MALTDVEIDSREAWRFSGISPGSYVKLTRRILEIRPDIPVLISTGYSEAVTEEKVAEMGARGFLMKPIMRRDLARTIRKILDGG